MGFFDWLNKTTHDAGHTAAEIGNAYVKGQQARADLSRLGDLLGMITGVATDPRVVERIKELAANAAQDVLSATVSDPAAAREPAAHVLAACTEVDRVATGVLDWYFKRTRGLHLPSLRDHTELAEVTEQLQRMKAALWFVAQQCEYAGGRLLQRHHPLYALAVREVQALPPRVELADSLVALPARPYRSTAEQIHDVRRRVAWLAAYFHGLAERSARSIQQASFNQGLGYSPAEVWAEAAVLTAKMIEGMASITALANLAGQKVSDGGSPNGHHKSLSEGAQCEVPASEK